MKLNLLLCAIEVLGLLYVAMFERRAALKARCNAVVRREYSRDITWTRALMIVSLAASVMILVRQYAGLAAGGEDFLACLPFCIYALAWLRFDSLTETRSQTTKRRGPVLYWPARRHQ